MQNSLHHIKTWVAMFVLFLSMASFASWAETYLCIPEAGAAVSHDRNGKFQSGAVDVSSMKLIQSNENGSWAVTIIGWDAAVFDKCRSQYYCENKSGYTGTFLKDKSNVYSMAWQPDIETFAVAKGMCTKIR